MYDTGWHSRVGIIALLFKRRGCDVTDKARKDLEKKTGKRVVSDENYLSDTEKRKRLKEK